MNMGHIWVAVLTLSAFALAATRALPADAASLEGHWELHVVDINAPPGCKVQEDRVVIVTERNGRVQGRVGMYFYRDIERSGDSLKARYPGKWDGVLGSKAVEAALNARKLDIRFEGRLSGDGNKIVINETIPCANHSDDRLNHVSEYQTTGTLKRVDLTIGFVQQQNGAWRKVSTIDFGQPFRVEVRAARELWLESYPVTFSWLDAPKSDGQAGGYKAVTATVHRVESDPAIYRSETFHLKRPAEGATAARPQDAAGDRVLEPAPGNVLYAVVGNQLVLDFAAEARAGAPKQLPLGAAFAAALLLAGWLAVRLVTSRLAAPSRAIAPAPKTEPQAAGTETTNLHIAPAAAPTGQRDNERKPFRPLGSGESPAFQVRAKRGEAFTTVRLKGATG